MLRNPTLGPRALLLGLCLATSAAWAQSHEDRLDALERRVEADRKLLHDWGGLIRYGSENTEVPKRRPGETRVVFFGDDTFDLWDDRAEFFPGKPYFNRGVAGQTTPQMLVRFRQDVIKLDPAVVILQGGMNDIASLTGPSTQGMMIENYQSMIELAQAHGIQVVLASLLPICDCGTNQTALRPRGKIFGVNDWLEEYAEEHGLVYLNFYGALADGREFRRDLTDDGLVPNAAGYKAMAPLAEAAIAEAVAQSQRPPR